MQLLLLLLCTPSFCAPLLVRCTSSSLCAPLFFMRARGLSSHLASAPIGEEHALHRLGGGGSNSNLSEILRDLFVFLRVPVNHTLQKNKRDGLMSNKGRIREKQNR